MKKVRIEERLFVNWIAVVVWILGVFLYYQLVKFDFILGATVPVMLITGILYYIVVKVKSNFF